VGQKIPRLDVFVEIPLALVVASVAKKLEQITQ